MLQTRTVAYRGQIVATVVADSFEAARDAARLVRVDLDAEQHDVVLREDDPKLYAPDKVNPTYETDTQQGDPDAALEDSQVVHAATYATPAYHNNPMEPHAALAVWDGDDLTLHDSNQGPAMAHGLIAKVLGPGAGAAADHLRARRRRLRIARACRARPRCSRRSPRRPSGDP